MIIENINSDDICELAELQPDGWDDIMPHFRNYINSSYSGPLKLIADGKIAGIGTYICHRNSAWLAHIIVHKDCRNKGYGFEITKALLKKLSELRIKTIYLDATELGYPVYLKAGFSVESEYYHFSGSFLSSEHAASPSVILFDEKYKDEILRLDRIVSGEYREKVLSEHLISSKIFLKRNKIKGIYFPSMKDGMIAASSVEAGTELMRIRMKEKETAGIPAENVTARDFAIENGFKQIRKSKRMLFGKPRRRKPEWLYNRISGALG